MKILLFICFFLSLGSVAFSQSSVSSKLIEKGLRLFEKGNYYEALSYYDIALSQNPEHTEALAEKARTMNKLENYNEAVKLCKKAYKTDKQHPIMKSVYITWGNSLDEMSDEKQALSIYDEGITKFPDATELYLNKGITLTKMKKYNEALQSFEKTIELDPYHASAHNLIGRIHYYEHPVQSLLAFARFILIEFEGARAEEDLQLLLTILNPETASISKDSSRINIGIPEKMMEEIENTQLKDNNFARIEVQLSLLSSLNFDDNFKKKDKYQQLALKLDHLLKKMEESRQEERGFYWEYYVPYFIEMKEKGFLDLFTHLIFLPEKDPVNIKWLVNNEKTLDSFYNWDKNYQWNPSTQAIPIKK